MRNLLVVLKDFLEMRLAPRRKYPCYFVVLEEALLVRALDGVGEMLGIGFRLVVLHLRPLVPIGTHKSNQELHKNAISDLITVSWSPKNVSS